MTLRRKSWLLRGLLSAALFVGCNGSNGGGDANGDGAPPGDAVQDGIHGDVPIGACGTDTDGDGIPDNYEGTGDFDMDGMPNFRDPDSDNDGRPDGLEANQGNSYDCRMSPVDSDHDGNPDFIDLDSDNNGIPDAQDFVGTGMTPDGGWALHAADFNNNHVPDYCDLDDDGDGIGDAIEIAPGGPGAPTDTNMDGIPDYHDVDSDGDTISDRDDGNRDDDSDGIPDFRDTDSDNDGILDNAEAGDMMLNTPPVECPRELNAMTLVGYMNDGLQDFRDIDSDNDGLSDHDEMMYGTDRCNPDTNGNGTLDSVDVVWCNQHHQNGCASQMGFTIPTTDYYLILPNNGPQVQRELEFGTNIRVADVFFIFDTTGSMSSVQHTIAQTIATPTTGIVDQIRMIIPNTYFGVGHHDDFPTGSYGSPGTDRAIHPLCSGPVGSSPAAECQMGHYGGIIEQPPERAMDVQTGALAIPGGSGDDTPESQVEALYQIPTNDGLYDHSDPMACAGSIGGAPCWVRPTQCPEGTWGYPCFRDGSLGIAVLFTDASFHNGARDLSPPSTTYWSPYTGISPAPHNFDDQVQAFLHHGARQIMINAQAGEFSGGQSCQGHIFTNHTSGGGFGDGPCFDMRMSSEGTGSVDVDGVDLVYDLPSTSGGPSAAFAMIIAQGVQELATRVPQDINTRTRNDPANPDMVDASQFIKRRVPSCQIPPINTNCWTEPMTVTHQQAVARTDLSTFYRVVPGTRVRFTIYFQNDGVYPGSYTSVSLFHAFIDVLGDGASLLDTRDVFILVPVRQPDLG